MDNNFNNQQGGFQQSTPNYYQQPQQQYAQTSYPPQGTYQQNMYTQGYPSGMPPVNMQQPPVKNKKPKTGLVIAIAVVLIALIALTLFLLRDRIFGSKDKGYTSAHEVIIAYWSAFDECNEDTFNKVFPYFAINKKEMVESNLTLAKNQKDTITVDLNGIAIDEQVYSELASLKDKSSKITDAKLCKVVVPLRQLVAGTEYDVLDYYDIIVVKSKDGWYIWDVTETDVQLASGDITTEATTEEIATEVTTESMAVITTEAVTEATTANTTEVAEIPPASGELGNDLASLSISIDGKSYVVPFEYSYLADKYTFNLADYGYDNGYVLNPGGGVTTTIALEGDMDAKFDFWVGFINMSNEIKDIKNCWVDGLQLDSAWAKTNNYPSVILPGGITWGSTYDEVIAAYGEPTEEPYYADSLGYYTLNYEVKLTDNPNGFKLVKYRFNVYDDRGVTLIYMKVY